MSRLPLLPSNLKRKIISSSLLLVFAPLFHFYLSAQTSLENIFKGIVSIPGDAVLTPALNSYFSFYIHI